VRACMRAHVCVSHKHAHKHTQCLYCTVGLFLKRHRHTHTHTDTLGSVVCISPSVSLTGRWRPWRKTFATPPPPLPPPLSQWSALCVNFQRDKWIWEQELFSCLVGMTRKLVCGCLVCEWWWCPTATQLITAMATPPSPSSSPLSSPRCTYEEKNKQYFCI